MNLLIAAVVLWAWADMAFQLGEGGRLTAPGLGSLKYFTVLSNLLQAAASGAFSACLIRAMRGRAGGVPRGVAMLKYAAAVSVSLTFMTVMLFLGPMYGYGAMFTGPNFWFHLIVPLAAALEFCLIDREGVFSFRDTFWAVLPMLIYGIGYVLNMLVNGVGQWPDTNDWYGFAQGGPAWAAVAFAVILAGTWGIALVLRLTRRKKE